MKPSLRKQMRSMIGRNAIGTQKAVQIMLGDKEVLWITPLTSFSRVKASYIAYGNEASIGYRYGKICLVVKKAGADVDEKETGTRRCAI